MVINTLRLVVSNQSNTFAWGLFHKNFSNEARLLVERTVTPRLQGRWWLEAISKDFRRLSLRSNRNKEWTIDVPPNCRWNGKTQRFELLA